MSAKPDKNVRIITEVSEECRVELKILALRKRTTLPILVKDILERAMSKKINSSIETTNE